METLKKKLAILKTISGDLSAAQIKSLASMCDRGLLVQTNMPDKPFHKPYGKAYAGRDVDVDLYYWTTFDGCRTWSFDGKVFSITILDGDSLTGEPIGKRGTWEFEFDEVDWWTLTFISEKLDRDWDWYVEDAFEQLEKQDRKNRLSALSTRLLNEKVL